MLHDFKLYIVFLLKHFTLAMFLTHWLWWFELLCYTWLWSQIKASWWKAVIKSQCFKIQVNVSTTYVSPSCCGYSERKRTWQGTMQLAVQIRSSPKKTLLPGAQCSWIIRTITNEAGSKDRVSAWCPVFWEKYFSLYTNSQWAVRNSAV